MAEGLPPGTVLLQDFDHREVVLSPTPSHDPNEPLNWSSGRKVLHMGLLGLYCICAYAILNVQTPFWADLVEQLDMTYSDLNNGYATACATLATGCIFMVPLAKRYGRRPVYIFTTFLMLATAIWGARMETIGDMIGLNVVGGFAGSINEALFQVTVSDLFFVHQRARVNGYFLVVVMVSNFMSSTAAGYAAVNLGWRWVYWIMTIIIGVTVLVLIFALEESKYVPLLDGHPPEASSLSNDIKQVQQPEEHKQDASGMKPQDARAYAGSLHNDRIDQTIPLKSYSQRHAFWTVNKTAPSSGLVWTILRPFYLLVRIPAVAFTALQYGWIIGMIGLLIVTLTVIYAAPPYNFQPNSIGLVNIAPTIGALLGTLACGFGSDWLVVKIARARGGIYEPETRLYLYAPSALVLLAGSLMFGLSIGKGMAWPVNVVGYGMFGFGMGGCTDLSVTYLQDSYFDILGDSLTVVVFVRNIVAMILVYVTSDWMNNLGVYDMYTSIGVINAVVLGVVVPMTIYGRSLRVKTASLYKSMSLVRE